MFLKRDDFTDEELATLKEASENIVELNEIMGQFNAVQEALVLSERPQQQREELNGMPPDLEALFFGIGMKRQSTVHPVIQDMIKFTRMTAASPKKRKSKEEELEEEQKIRKAVIQELNLEALGLSLKAKRKQEYIQELLSKLC